MTKQCVFSFYQLQDRINARLSSTSSLTSSVTSSTSDSSTDSRPGDRYCHRVTPVCCGLELVLLDVFSFEAQLM